MLALPLAELEVLVLLSLEDQLIQYNMVLSPYGLLVVVPIAEVRSAGLRVFPPIPSVVGLEADVLEVLGRRRLSVEHIKY